MSRAFAKHGLFLRHHSLRIEAQKCEQLRSGQSKLTTADKSVDVATKLEKAKAICGFHFNKKGLLSEALHAAGAVGGGPEGNRRLALVGDKVIGLFVIERGYSNGLQNSRNADRLDEVASNANFDYICHKSGLVDCIIAGPRDFKLGTTDIKTTSATVEAVVGAAYKTGGMPAAGKVMRSLKII